MRGSTTCTRAGRPQGQAAPVDGWSGSVAPAARSTTTRENTCAARRGAGRGAGRPDRFTRRTSTSRHGRSSAPAWRSDSQARRSGGLATPTVVAPSNATYEFWLAGPNNERCRSTNASCTLAVCNGRGRFSSSPIAPENRVTVPERESRLALLRQCICAAVSRDTNAPPAQATQTATPPPSTSTPPT